MTPFPCPHWLAALALAAGPAATPAVLAAPPASSLAAADPTQALASVPAATYRSAFVRYRPLVSVTPIPWREANDTATRIGGWRAYAREAAQPEAAASAAASASAPAAPSAAVPTPSSLAPPAKEHPHGR